MKELIGRMIERIKIDTKENSLIRFETSDGPLTYFAEGDCCSESWFADIYNVSNLLNGVVDEVNRAYGGYDGYNTEDGRCRQESDEVYCYKFSTDRGEASIIFRNSSNGYYGGEIILSEKHTKYIDTLEEFLEDIGPDLRDEWHSAPK